MEQLSIFGQLIPLKSFLRKKRSLLVSRFVTGVVLDVGCGPAQILEYLSDPSIKYVGVDTNKSQINSLRKKYAKSQFFWINVDQEKLPDFNTKFDTVLLIAVIEHLKCPQKLFEEIASITNPSSKLIITTATPAGEHVHNILALFGLTSLEAIREHKTAAHASYSYKEISALVVPFGFTFDQCLKFEFGLNQVVCFKKASF